MDIASILQQSGAIGSIAQQLGVDEGVAQMGANALLPSILGGFKKTAQAQAQTESGGMEGLGGLLGQLGGGGLFDSVVAPEPTPVDQGNNILGQIFGSKDVSRTVADHASGQTGIDPSILKKMLPILAMLVAGYMAKQSGGEGAGGLGGMLGGLLGGGTAGGAGGGLGGMLGGLLGGGQQAAPVAGGMGGLAGMLDMDGDGNPLDDILAMAGKMMR
jgi:hypothetical protein